MGEISQEEMQRRMQAVINDVVGFIKGEPGWAVLAIFGTETEPGYAYTVGLQANFNHPELILFGLDSSVAQQSLNDLAQKVKDGHRFEDMEIEDELFNLPATIRSCNESARELLRLGKVIYGAQPFEVMQVYWPDTEGLFPWEDGFNTSLAKHQPVWTIQEGKCHGGLQ